MYPTLCHPPLRQPRRHFNTNPDPSILEHLRYSPTTYSTPRRSIPIGYPTNGLPGSHLLSKLNCKSRLLIRSQALMFPIHQPTEAMPRAHTRLATMVVKILNPPLHLRNDSATMRLQLTRKNSNLVSPRWRSRGTASVPCRHRLISWRAREYLEAR
jgi:hypothetical protein